MSVTNTVVRRSSLESCGSDDHEDCGLELILVRLGEQWTVKVLAELAGGPLRYRVLERALDGISQRMLTLTLRRLERDGHLLRHVEPAVPPKVTYELTELGHAFAAQVATLVEWSRQRKEAINAAQDTFDASGRD